jgi:exosortase/archaeosortase family protein
MRQLTGFLALTAAVAYLTSRPGWYKALVVLSALPIAMTANVARVVLTGYIMHFINPQYASGAYHTLEGILMMGLGLLLLNFLCSLLNQCFPDDRDHGQASMDDPPSTAKPLAGRPVLSGPGGWSGAGISDNMGPLRAPKELS